MLPKSERESPAQKLARSKPPRVVAERKESPDAVWHCNLRTARLQLRLTLDDVAEAVGMSKTGLWQIEHGSDPMLTTAAKLATFFDVPIEWLWPGPPAKDKNSV